jgi:hypothetical protein
MKVRHLQADPEREYRISGTYKTTRDGGLDYTYSATWEIEPLGLNWSAEITRNGRVVGRPRGIFWHDEIDHAAHLHRLIGRYIENGWIDAE